ncbi:MAG: tetratricopeptide repeat protein [Spongiibacteraceae bacterium]
MAEDYQTEDEQVEALKTWWRENGKSTVATVVIAIVAVFGWQGWQKQQEQELSAASAIYQNLMVASTGNNGIVTDAQAATARHLADTLKNDFSSTTYARFAAFYKAKFAVDANDLPAAEQELRWVLDNGSTPELILQARLRLARVLAAQQKFTEALAQLEDDAGGMPDQFAEVRGDIYLASGDKAKALEAYQKALMLAQALPQSAGNPLLNLKIQQLNSNQMAVINATETGKAIKTIDSADANSNEGS